jgi:hypothetical protein
VFIWMCNERGPIAKHDLPRWTTTADALMTTGPVPFTPSVLPRPAALQAHRYKG